MTNGSSSGADDLPKRIECDSGEVEAAISALLKESFSFPGEQYFNKIMLDQMPPEKLRDPRIINNCRVTLTRCCMSESGRDE